jgi:putative cell wall-binding protein
MLLTHPGMLDSRVEVELTRILRPGSPVTVLGGEGALSPSVLERVKGLGFVARRIAGVDRYATAVEVAKALPNLSVFVETTGLAFPDALVSGPVAARKRGAVLLTAGPALPPVVVEFLSQHREVPRISVGGAAAAADPTASPVVGADRYETAARLAGQQFASGNPVGISSGLSYADGLTGASHIAALGGALLLTRPDRLPASTRDHIVSMKPSAVVVYGGPSAVGSAVRAELNGLAAASR